MEGAEGSGVSRKTDQGQISFRPNYASALGIVVLSSNRGGESHRIGGQKEETMWPVRFEGTVINHVRSISLR